MNMYKCQVQNNYPLIYHYSKRIHVPYFHSLKKTFKKNSNEHRKHKILPSSAPDTKHRKTRYESWRDVAAMLSGSSLKGCI